MSFRPARRYPNLSEGLSLQQYTRGEINNKISSLTEAGMQSPTHTSSIDVCKLSAKPVQNMQAVPAELLNEVLCTPAYPLWKLNDINSL